MKKISMIIAVLFLSSLLFAGCSIKINGKEITSFDVSADGGNTAEKSEVKDIPLASQTSIEVDNVKGEIVFTAWDKNQVQVNIVKKVRAGGSQEKLNKYLEDLKVETSTNSDTVEISVKYVNGLWGSSSQNVNLQVMVPASIKKVKGKEASGRIRVNGLKGLDTMDIVSVSGSIEVENAAAKDYDISTTSGSINARNIEGNGYIHSISGSIDMESLKGDVSSKTMSGSIEGNGMEGVFQGNSVSGRISLDTKYLKETSSAHTISGSIEINAAKMDDNGNYSFDSTSGSVHLGLPSDAGFKLDASSVSGSVNCDYDVTVRGGSSKRTKLEGTVGSGGAEMNVRTISGSINISKR